jgi:hypothetical protein
MSIFRIGAALALAAMATANNHFAAEYEPSQQRREPKPPRDFSSWRESQKPLTKRQKRRLRGKP